VNHAQQTPEFFSSHVRDARRFYLDLAPDHDSPLVVVCGGVESCAPEYTIDRQTFPYYSLEFVARGRGSLVLDGQRVALFPGVVFAYGPGVAQHITTEADDPLEKYFVDFAGTRAVELLERYSLPPAHWARVRAIAEIQSIFDNLICDGLRGTGFCNALCAALLEYLIVHVADSRMPWEARQTPAFATYQRCRKHLATHFERIQSLEQAAQECHVDRAYLCRLFRRYDRQTPYRFLMRLKMNLAAERLQDPGVLVKQVAAQLGFADPFHFSRAFKNTFGRSPEAFRRLR
jgi:AraC-like DNA-binding protein